MPGRVFLLVLISALCLCAPGCSLLTGNFREPEVQLADVRFEDVTLFETGVLFTVRIDNDNPFPLTVSGGTHRFFLNDFYVGKGHTRESFEIPARSTTTEEIKVFLSNFSLLNRIATLVEQQKFDYRLESLLTVRRGLGRRDVEVIKEGSLLLPVNSLQKDFAEQQ